jgi:hypothetical protein
MGGVKDELRDKISQDPQPVEATGRLIAANCSFRIHRTKIAADEAEGLERSAPLLANT